MSRLLFSDIHETEALSPKPSSATTITLLNQKYPSSTSIVSVLCLVISVLALLIIFLGVLHLIFKFLRKSSTLFQIRDFNINSDLSPSSPQLQNLFFLHDSGLDQTSIDALPVFLYGDVTMSLKEPFDCAVCLNEFSDTDKLRLLPVCSHAFHLHCIDTWLLSNSTCPLCRRSLSTSNVCFNKTETLVVPFSRLQQVDEGKASLSKRVFSVRLGRYKSMNESQSQRHEVKGETGVGVPRKCYDGHVSVSRMQSRFCGGSVFVSGTLAAGSAAGEGGDDRSPPLTAPLDYSAIIIDGKTWYVLDRDATPRRHPPPPPP